MHLKLERLVLPAVYCFGLILLLTHSLRAEVEAPEKAVDTFLSTIRAMEFPVNDSARHEKLLEQADAYLDIEAMAKEALRLHWAAVSPQEQKVFLALLWELIEKVAYPQSKEFMGALNILYPDVQEKNNGFEVQSEIEHETDEALNAHVIFHLYRDGDQWKIDDVILDDISMIEDLKHQWDKIIEESSFSGMLDRMRDRLAEAEQKNKGAGS